MRILQTVRSTRAGVTGRFCAVPPAREPGAVRVCAVGKDGPCLERYEEAALKAHRLPPLNPTRFSGNTGPGTKGAREA
jgi:hypothetical protein